ncbi:hypothetical protein QBC36DRAFT_303043 [Triangularia setosa]|uniref:Uncharacterized protein n=1 Tax=Triangularia setosa TaxID=2587417 RepID=A0AAN6W2T5_9PEZI|nr:hypothetical protein QBC36DRAFT_303043 [Podospora setosa]
MNASFELYTALEQSNVVSEACSSTSSSAWSLYNWATKTTPSLFKAPNNRTRKGNWIRNLDKWKDEANDSPNLDSMPYSPNTTTRAITRTKVMCKLEDHFRDKLHFVVYTHKFQQPANRGETIEGAFFSWVMANKFLVSLDPKTKREFIITHQVPEKNSLPWELLQKRFLQAPYDTLQVFNWTYPHDLLFSPKKKANNPKGTNLVLTASEGPCSVVKEFCKSEHWQLIFLCAFYKAVLPGSSGPLSVGTILGRIMKALEETQKKEVGTQRFSGSLLFLVRMVEDRTSR